MHVALGGSAREVQHLRVDDYAAYARQVRRMFETFVTSGDAAFPPPTRPDPVEHCEVCRWIVDCKAVRRRTDDLSLVAGITGRQRRGLREHAVPTRRSLAALHAPDHLAHPGHGSRSARTGPSTRRSIQVEGEQAGQPPRTSCSPRSAIATTASSTPNLGLLSLPEPSPGDLFFDIEGDPFALDDGIDYLFGVLEPSMRGVDGQPTFHSIWSLDAAGDVTLDAEKRAFEQLIDFFMDRLARDPSLHIYHYAPYEPTAIGRLMGRHGTREAEVDRLMRGKVFVDLFRAVRQGLRASVESYSIKRLEPLYGFERTVDLRDAGSSIVEFETWLELGGDRAAAGPEILERIEGYNRDDVVSTHLLRDWLEERRPELAARIGEAMPRPDYKTGDPPPTLSEKLAVVKETADRADRWRRCRSRGPDRGGARSLAARPAPRVAPPRGQARVVALLRADRAPDRRGASSRSRSRSGCWSSCARSGPTRSRIVYEYRFPAQEHDIKTGRSVVDPATRKGAGEIVALDNEAGTLQLKRGKATPHPTSLVPETVVHRRHGGQPASDRAGRSSRTVSIGGPRFAAARDLLLRRAACRRPVAGPVAGAPGGGRGEGGCAPDRGRPAVRRPRDPGPAGVRQVDDRRGHDRRPDRDRPQGGGHLEQPQGDRQPAGQGRPKRRGTRGIPSGSGRSQPPTRSRPAGAPGSLKDNERRRRGPARSARCDVVGGTPWLWAREEFEGAVDALFVDEAGQVSLANVLAVSPAAPVLVLLGDPQQLDQPIQGTHPPGAERSALAHLLGDAPTMPPELGLFLEHTWRLHPAIAAFTSSAFYAAQARLQDGCERQVVHRVRARSRARACAGSSVDHVGNDNDSLEEADAIRDLIQRPAAFAGRVDRRRGRRRAR